jgi:uncharacterized membrane protein (UPF0182 family)
MQRSLSARSRPRLLILFGVLVLLLIFGRSICGLAIDYLWWREMDQVSTWLRRSIYLYATSVAQWLILFVAMWIAHARGMKHAGTSLREHRQYARIVTLGLAVFAMVVAAASMSGWIVARYAAGSGMDSTWHDPVFGRSLVFYFFELPFYTGTVGFLETIAVVSALAYYLTARAWQIRLHFPHFAESGFGSAGFDWASLRVLGRLETGVLQFLMALFLVDLAVSFWLDRFELLYTDHGNLLVGLDYVQQHLGLPLQYAKAGAALLAAALVLARKRRWALGCLVVLVFDVALPPLVSGLYVKPNELSLEKPFLERHIEATRAAFGLDRHAQDVEFPAHMDGKIDFTRNQAMLDNVRLWDWSAFHDTLSQSQPLRPYGFANTDVDRYPIGGKMRQVLLAPRELDLNQLGEAQNSWINANFRFTHGYGLVLAEASRITAAGSPELLIKDAPVEVLTPSLKLTRPEIYYSEKAHEPIFVHTNQPEFNYPAEPDDVSVSYEGQGGFPMASPLLRFVTAVAEGDWNIMLSNPLNAESRMMIHRRVLDRLQTLAEFIQWDDNPYMVITDAGRLVWIVDGYMTSDAHPYAKAMATADGGSYNYIRNSVKATVDAYDGTVHMYVFDQEDPMIRAYQRLFPDLFTPFAEIPPDLRSHLRSPEGLFRVQAEMYRTYHMREPESFYNRADLWDLATSSQGQSAAQTVTPTYMIATLPGETQPEFVLTIPFTPRNKQNLIGLMVARCDGAHLGEVVFLQLPKQEIIKGPLQIEALVNQDQVISKDLTLWGQQGSTVLRPPILTLPIDQTFLFVAPIYIQANEARMPQLRKVVLAVGNTLAYEDTYEKALASLAAMQKGVPVTAEPTAGSAPVSATTPAPPSGVTADTRLDAIRTHMQRYKELSAQGHWAEAGKELEAIEAAVKK